MSSGRVVSTTMSESALPGTLKGSFVPSSLTKYQLSLGRVSHTAPNDGTLYGINIWPIIMYPNTIIPIIDKAILMPFIPQYSPTFPII